MRRILISFLVLLVAVTGGYSSELHDAVAANNLKLVQKLLREGADINEGTYNDFRPLHFAHEPAMVEMLLKYKPRLNEVSIDGTPLQMAASEAAQSGKEK